MQILPFRTDGTELGYVLCRNGAKQCIAMSTATANKADILPTQKWKYEAVMESCPKIVASAWTKCVFRAIMRNNAVLRCLLRLLICRPPRFTPTAKLRIRCLWRSRWASFKSREGVMPSKQPSSLPLATLSPAAEPVFASCLQASQPNPRNGPGAALLYEGVRYVLDSVQGVRSFEGRAGHLCFLDALLRWRWTCVCGRPESGVQLRAIQWGTGNSMLLSLAALTPWSYRRIAVCMPG
ncbi:hypothetical protein V8C35DRAFT_158087 [Trichoderma chlorosporum]